MGWILDDDLYRSHLPLVLRRLLYVGMNFQDPRSLQQDERPCSRTPMLQSCHDRRCCRKHPRACRNLHSVASRARATVRPNTSAVRTHRAHVAARTHRVHVTYMAFSGGDNTVREVGLSAYSLSRVSTEPTEVVVLTDTEHMRRSLSHTLANHASSLSWSVSLMQREQLVRRFASFGLRRVMHHSGWGGYAKLVAAELLPATLNYTLLVDTDTVFAADVSGLWTFMLRSTRRAVLAAKRIARQEGSCLHGQRINSGVLAMNLRRQRQLNWTGRLLAHAAYLSAHSVPARHCGKMVRNGTVRAGDQELLGLACFRALGECVALPPRFHQDRCEGIALPNGVIFHFNCGARPDSHCPRGSACLDMATEFAIAEARLRSRGVRDERV